MNFSWRLTFSRKAFDRIENCPKLREISHRDGKLYSQLVDDRKLSRSKRGAAPSRQQRHLLWDFFGKVILAFRKISTIIYHRIRSRKARSLSIYIKYCSWLPFNSKKNSLYMQLIYSICNWFATKERRCFVNNESGRKRRWKGIWRERNLVWLHDRKLSWRF